MKRKALALGCLGLVASVLAVGAVLARPLLFPRRMERGLLLIQLQP